ncbi:uncharacterized protein TNCV_4802981 [Trichonephila clavipes]|nr:uncharacterized protein TNCV_4802981 [Trichonephila clavipes]
MDCYCHTCVIETFLRPKLNQFLGDHEEEIWLQQDGATAHTSRRQTGILRVVSWTTSLFGRRHRLAPKGSLIRHLMILVIYHFWEHLKAQVYKHRPILQALKEAIAQSVAAILQEITRRTMDNFRESLRQCITIGGRPLTDIIFKTN